MAEVLSGTQMRQQRKAAYDELVGSLNKLSVKHIVDFRGLEQPSPEIQTMFSNVLTLVSEVDDSLDIGKEKNWKVAQRIMQKPGHFINAMRRFPYAVDSGRISATNFKSVVNNMRQATAEVDQHPVTQQMRMWLDSAIGYYDLMKNQEASTNGAPPKKIGASYAYTPPRSSPGLQKKNSNASSGGPKYLKQEDSISRNQNRPRSAYHTREGAHGAANPAQQSNVSSSADVRRLALGGLPEWEIELEQMRREVRDLKSREMKAKWDLKREEKALIKKKKAEDAEDIRIWRNEELIKSQTIAEQIKEETKAKELRDSKAYQQFKRETRKHEQEEQIKYVEEQYHSSKEQAEFRVKLMEQEQQLEKQRAVEATERVNIEREIKRANQAEAKEEEGSSRLVERKLEIEKMKKDLLKQKEELMRAVSYTASRFDAKVKEDFWM